MEVIRSNIQVKKKKYQKSYVTPVTCDLGRVDKQRPLVPIKTGLVLFLLIVKWRFGDKSNCTWRVVSTIGIGVLWLSKDTGGHLVFPNRRLLLISTK